MIPWWLRNLGSGFSFLFLIESSKFSESKRILEFIVPIFFAVGYTLIYIAYSEIFATDILEYFDTKLFSVMSFMVPFHLAALAILASIRSDVLDSMLAGQNASIRVWSNAEQKIILKDLKLREYISLLIGYLCTIGILYITCSIFLNSIYIVISHPVLIAILLFMFVWFFVHYMVMSYYAIYFIVNKFS